MAERRTEQLLKAIQPLTDGKLFVTAAMLA
jgi:hypothetical protein